MHGILTDSCHQLGYIDAEMISAHDLRGGIKGLANTRGGTPVGMTGQLWCYDRAKTGQQKISEELIGGEANVSTNGLTVVESIE